MDMLFPAVLVSQLRPVLVLGVLLAIIALNYTAYFTTIKLEPKIWPYLLE